jgi:uncharacterized protein
VTLKKLSRLRDTLASDEGSVEAFCEFSRDEERRSVVAISVKASLQVSCQRCLEPMPVQISSENRLAIVGDDEQARQLPTSLDPLVVPGEKCDLWSLVEDELMLGLPIVSYHDTDECRALLQEYSEPPSLTEESEQDNPFKVLEQLKPGSKT